MESRSTDMQNPNRWSAGQRSYFEYAAMWLPVAELWFERLDENSRAETFMFFALFLSAESGELENVEFE